MSWTLMDMIKTNTSTLKAKLGHYMRAVKSGRTVVITDRDRPVARLVPLGRAPSERGRLVIAPRDPAAPPLGRVTVRGVTHRGPRSLALLLEDRQRR